jgi:hypothetical protein
VEVVENNYKNIYYIMKQREIMNILILVGSAFLLVAVLSYFNLYEGMESGLYEGLEGEEQEGLEGEEEKVEGMEGEEEGMEGEEQEGLEGEEQEGLVVAPTQGVAPSAGASQVLKYSSF